MFLRWGWWLLLILRRQGLHGLLAIMVHATPWTEKCDESIYVPIGLFWLRRAWGPLNALPPPPPPTLLRLPLCEAGWVRTDYHQSNGSIRICSAGGLLLLASVLCKRFLTITSKPMKFLVVVTEEAMLTDGSKKMKASGTSKPQA